TALTYLNGLEPPVPHPDAEAIASLAAPGLRIAMLVTVMISLAAMLPGAWAPRAQVLLAVAELGLVFQPYRIRTSNPQSILAGAGALRDYERAAVVGPGGAVLANFGPVLRVTQPAGYVSLFS